MTFKRFCRLLLLAIFIGLACALPIPITFKSKDNLPKHFIEQIDNQENDDDQDDIKELF